MYQYQTQHIGVKIVLSVWTDKAILDIINQKLDEVEEETGKRPTRSKFLSGLIRESLTAIECPTCRGNTLHTVADLDPAAA